MKQRDRKVIFAGLDEASDVKNVRNDILNGIHPDTGESSISFELYQLVQTIKPLTPEEMSRYENTRHVKEELEEIAYQKQLQEIGDANIDAMIARQIGESRWLNG